MVKEPKELNDSELKNRTELCYEWIARYIDGTEIKEFDEEKKTVANFGCIDPDKVYEFELIPTRPNLYPIKINLDTGLFSIDNKSFLELYQGEQKIPLGLALAGKNVESSWGKKAKLIYTKHVRRDFTPGPEGFQMKVSMIYEIGWEATVNGIHEKYLLDVDEQGRLGIPPTFEQQGFKAL